MKRIITLFAVLTLLLAACGSDDEAAETTNDVSTNSEGDTDADGDPDAGADGEVIVFVWSETGGCAQAGPNCARYEVTSLGNVSTYREGQDGVEVTGTIDAARVAQWMTIVEETNVDEMIGRLGPGEMTAAFDGVDFVLEAPHTNLRLSSVDVDFDPIEPLFQDAEQIAGLAAKAAPLEMQTR